MIEEFLPYIPENITIHLGVPSSYAENVTIPFPDYIKNVASSEIYPTWKEEAIRANIYAQVSYALNRVYVEFYRSQGYNFNITSSTAYDQKFTPGRNIFENVSQLVDELFNDYIRRKGFIEPLAAKYCNGTTVTCEGLSQWGSQDLALGGYSAFNILTNYYGNNIEIVEDAPIQGITNSYPGYPLSIGSSGPKVTVMQTYLNRISQDYPSIPKINPVDGIFGTNTENAVKRFQQIFNLTVDGIAGKATWNRINMTYSGIKRLSELESEGQTLLGLNLEYPDAIKLGDEGEKVIILQYFLAIISQFNDYIPPIMITGKFEEPTKNAVLAFQQNNNLPQTGVVDAKTWDELYDTFIGIVDTVFLNNDRNALTTEPYGGEVLKLGSKGSSVTTLQQYLNVISITFDSVSPVAVDGVYGENTRNSVIEYQKAVNLEPTGEVDRETWNSIANAYKDVVFSDTPNPKQFPGYTLKLGDKD